MGKRYTIQEDKYLIDNYSSMTPLGIAQALGRTSQSVQSRICLLRKTGRAIQAGLAAFTPRQLMEELKRRGSTGKLTYVETHVIDLENL